MGDMAVSVLGLADRFLQRIEDGVNLFAGLLIFALMLLGVIQILLRTVFESPIYGYIDVVEVAMVGFAVLSIAYVQRVGGHIQMELLISRLKGRTLWIAEATGTLLAIFIVAVLIPATYSHFERAFHIGDSTIDIEIVTWPAKLLVPVALSLLLVRLILQLVGYTRLVVQPDATHVAIPEIKTVVQKAQDEIDLSSASFNPPDREGD